MAENYFGLTDTGKQRTNNEDTFIAEKTANGKYIIAAVIDGVGGYAGGEIAAAIARDTIIEQINSSKYDVPATILAALHKANDKIFAERQRDKQHDSMACVCTLAIVDLQHNQFYFAHIGDTRLYLFRDGTLVKISSDHSFVGFLEESGRLTEEAAMKHPKRNEINKALGFETDIKDQSYFETGNSPFLPGDTLLLCSDGLTDMVSTHDITSILTSNNSLKETSRNLIDLANHNGGADNVTVVLVKNDKKPAAQDAVMPAVEQKKRPEPVAEPVVKTKPVVEHQVVEVEDERPKKKKRSGLGFIIALILLIAIVAIFYYQNSRFGSAPQNASATPPVTDTAAKPKGPSAEQAKLQQMLDGLKSDTLKLADSVFKTPIVLNSTIQINRDTLYIKPVGSIMFKADTGFKGAAFAIKKGAKVIVFTHLHFDGFKTAITAYNNSLVLKGVSFNNCETPVQVSFTPQTNLAVTGWLPPNAFRSDSVSQAPAPKKK